MQIEQWTTKVQIFENNILGEVSTLPSYVDMCGAKEPSILIVTVFVWNWVSIFNILK